MNEVEQEATVVVRRAPGVRVVVFFVLAAVICVGPLLRELPVENNPVASWWRMYHTRGRRLCAVAFEEVHENGARHRIERLPTLGYGAGAEVAAEEFLVRGMRKAHEQGRRICKVLGAKADVRMTAKCADLRAGWRETADGTRNICAKRVAR